MNTPVRGVKENIHPSQLPENQFRTQLHECFSQYVQPQISDLLGTASYQDALPGFERAWRIFIGANIEGQMYFICHIAENFSTAKAYNSVDITNPQCPIILYGEPFHIQKAVMNKIRQQFPTHHQGKIPCQATLSIIPSSNTGTSSDMLGLFSSDSGSIQRAGFLIQKMVPSGMQSLSFKSLGFPLEFWTHTSRAPVIFTALELETKEPSPNAALVALYEEACKYETAFQKAIDALATCEKTLADIGKDIQKANNSLKAAFDNPQIPQARKQQVIAEKKKLIGEIEAQEAAALTEREQLKQNVERSSNDIDLFKQTHYSKLPSSYRDATFQVAFDTTFPDGSVLYKQYNGTTGYFEVSTNASREVRYLNDVHNAYFNA